MSLDRCPDELLVAILSYVPSTDLATNVQRVSRRLNRLSNEPKLWHYHCCHDFVYWNEDKAWLLRTAMRRRMYNHPWKAMWLDRKRGDEDCAVYFERVIASKIHRVHHLSQICARQLESKDFLLRHYRFADEQAFRELEAGERGTAPPRPGPLDDCLARRYYAHLALSSIHRSLAVDEWIRVRDEPSPYARLDRAVAAFEMFSLPCGGMTDMDGVVDLLDGLADAFLHDHRDALPGMSVRQKAHALVGWLRSRGLMGMDDEAHNYRNVRNCLLGQALTDHPEHASLPLISSTIFACVGQRIGLQAYCVAVPGHVHATVIAPAGQTVDSVGGGATTTTTIDSDSDTDADSWWQQQRVAGPLRQSLTDNGERLFLDPYQDNHELSLYQLRRGMDGQLLSTMMPGGGMSSGFGAIDGNQGGDDDGNGPVHLLPRIHRDTYLLPAPTHTIVLRLANNIEASWAYARQALPDVARTVKQVRRTLPPWTPASVRADRERLLTRHRCGSDGDPHTDMERLTYGSAWASVLMRTTTTQTTTAGTKRTTRTSSTRTRTSSADWEEHLDRLLTRFAHEFNEDAWLLERYLLPIHDQYHGDAVASDPRGRHAVGRGVPMPMPLGDPGLRLRANAWTHVRNLLKMIHNLDRRQAQVSRRYTQALCEGVRYKVGQVMRHRRFGFVAVIDGWTPEDPSELPGPGPGPGPGPRAVVPQDEGPLGGAGAVGGGTRIGNPATPTTTRKRPYYSCLPAGSERRIVAQHNIEIVTDPKLIPPELMFVAGKHFKRFDYATCTFVSNLTEFFPDD